MVVVVKASSDVGMTRSNHKFSFKISGPVVDRVSCGEGASCIQARPSADMFYRLTCPSL